MLVRGKPGDSQDSLLASSIIVMKQADVAQKQQKDMQDWQSVEAAESSPLSMPQRAR